MDSLEDDPQFRPLSEEERAAADLIEPDEKDREMKIAEARAMVAECKPVRGTPAEDYLLARKIDPERLPRGIVGWHSIGRAMVSVARDSDGVVVACQRLSFGNDGKPLLDERGKKKRYSKGPIKGAALTIPGEGADVLVTEGAEDAFSLWLATGAPVRCSFGKGMMSDAPLPDGAPVIIVADNDGPGKESAEKAAMRLIERGHRVSIAIPEGAKDSNELLTMAGTDAVRGLVACAKPYEPRPAYISFEPYTMGANGLTTEIEKGSGENKTREKVWIAAPFEILGACRDPNGRAWGKWLRWRDGDNRQHVRHVSDAALQGDPAALCGTLADEGLRINRSQQRALVTYLSGANVRGRVTLVARTGWHEVGGHSVFVLPNETIGPHGAERVILEAAALGPYEARGSLDDWKNGVGALAHGHALPILAISAALAGPLLHLVGQEGGGLNFFGPSSKGKTTLLNLAASVWGRGTTSGYVRTWRATANGLEGAAASATDTALILDELGLAEPRDVAAVVYGLANGQGKTRAARDGSLREPKSWRVLFLSSGEITLGTKLAEDRGRKARAGQLVRMLDVPADRGLGFGAFDGAGPDGDAATLSTRLKQAAVSAYGTAGPEFVRRLIADNIDGDFIQAFVSSFMVSTVPVGADGQIDRAAQRLGLIAAAGEVATKVGVTPWQPGDARAAAAWALEQWIAGRGGTEPAEVRQAIEQVRLVIEQHGESRFEAIDDTDARPVINRLGWRKGAGQEREWWVPSEVWKSEFCAGLDSKLVARILGERGILERANDGWQPVRKVGGANKRVFVIKVTVFDGGEYAP